MSIIEFRATGVTFEGRQENLKKLAKQSEFTLKFFEDIHNEYDENAVKILATTASEEDIECGFVPKGTNKMIKDEIKNKTIKIIDGKITGGTQYGKPTYGMYIKVFVER